MNCLDFSLNILVNLSNAQIFSFSKTVFDKGNSFRN